MSLLMTAGAAALVLYALIVSWFAFNGGAKARNVALEWHPVKGAAGRFIPHKIRPNQRQIKLKMPGGDKVLFPLVPKYAAPYGKDGRGVAYILDMDAKTLVRLDPSEGTVRPNGLDLAGMAEDIREIKMLRAQKAMNGQNIPWMYVLIGAGVLIFFLTQQVGG